MDRDMEDITEQALLDSPTTAVTHNHASVGTAHDHQLWVNLSAFGDGNVFAVLPQLLKQLLREDSTDMADDFVDVILPSDDAWQTKIYYKLVEKQRLTGSATPTEMLLDTSLHDYEKETKLHDWIIRKSKSPVCETEPYSPQKRPKEVNKLAPITWTVSDISKAGCLLTTPPLNVTFDDEQEMRRVYTLIYDVFRYKQVLMEALNDVLFFQTFPNLAQTAPHVWLLFYDLYHRSFKKRETAVAPIAAKLFDATGLTFSETALWTQRVKLAASVARLRIKHNALSLSELLPQHLKDERATEKARNNPVTCWVNSVKVQDANWLIREIEKVFGLRMIDDVDRLDEGSFKWDRHCPQIICFHASMRTKLARSAFIRNHLMIVQDKSFCVGAATFEKLVADLELTGSVIQTHVNSPRTTAYLATLLSHNEKIKRLLAFSAGTRKTEYESYFHDLGMKNIRIFADRLIDLPQDAQYMEEVVAVFATPPNSYSAVSDPIDLVCSRGGDLSMLEALTESDETAEGNERVANILSEQKKTLRFAMSRPQIQFVLYETHSELSAENDGMVTKTLKDVNKLAKLQHAGLQGKIHFQSQVQEDQIIIDIREVNNNERLQRTEDDSGDRSKKSPTDVYKPVIDTEEDQFLDSIEIPDTDIFHIPQLPTLCPSENTCDRLKKEGCYLALIQRKEVIRLDDKYMIQMAENRGLFGSTNSAAVSKTKSKAKKKEKVVRKPRPRKKLKETEIERIAAPTHTFLRHTKDTMEVDKCKKCGFEEQHFTVSQYRRWWAEATRHVLNLKKCLSRHKIVPVPKFKPPPQTEAQKQQNIVDTFIGQSLKIDEIAAKCNNQSKFPIFPKLRLSRNYNIVRVEVPLTITNVEFPRQYCPFHVI